MFEKSLTVVINSLGIILFLRYLLFPNFRPKDKIRRFSVGVLLFLWAMAGITSMLGL